MTKDIRVRLTLRQAKVVASLISPYAEKSALVRDVLTELDKATEYRKNNPSTYRQRRAESREHLQWKGNQHGDKTSELG